VSKGSAHSPKRFGTLSDHARRLRKPLARVPFGVEKYSKRFSSLSSFRFSDSLRELSHSFLSAEGSKWRPATVIVKFAVASRLVLSAICLFCFSSRACGQKLWSNGSVMVSLQNDRLEQIFCVKFPSECFLHTFQLFGWILRPQAVSVSPQPRIHDGKAYNAPVMSGFSVYPRAVDRWQEYGGFAWLELWIPARRSLSGNFRSGFYFP